MVKEKRCIKIGLRYNLEKLKVHENEIRNVKGSSLRRKQDREKQGYYREKNLKNYMYKNFPLN